VAAHVVSSVTQTPNLFPLARLSLARRGGPSATCRDASVVPGGMMSH